MLKRPLPRTVSYDLPPRVPADAPCRVLDIIRACGVKHPSKTTWTPPQDYEFVAKHMPDEEAVLFLARVAEFYERHPKLAIPPKAAMPYTLIQEPLYELKRKYPMTTPPLSECVVAWHRAGYPSSLVAKWVESRQKRENLGDELDAYVEKMFAKYPGINKPAPKKKAAIKAVVKLRPVPYGSVVGPK